MQELEQTLDSREVAEMVEKVGYCSQADNNFVVSHFLDIFNERQMSLVDFSTGAKISPVDFWGENIYTDAKEELKKDKCRQVN